MPECQTKAGYQECFEKLEKLSQFSQLSLSHSLTLDMLNNFCFHVYAQKSLIIGENGNDFFFDTIHTRSTDIRVHRAGSQLKTRTSLYGDIHYPMASILLCRSRFYIVDWRRRSQRTRRRRKVTSYWDNEHKLATFRVR